MIREPGGGCVWPSDESHNTTAQVLKLYFRICKIAVVIADIQWSNSVVA